MLNEAKINSVSTKVSLQRMNNIQFLRHGFGFINTFSMILKVNMIWKSEFYVQKRRMPFTEVESQISGRARLNLTVTNTHMWMPLKLNSTHPGGN